MKLTDVCFFFSYREQALTEATNKPLFSKASRSLRGVVKYPYVFDSLLAAQQSGAYVGGCKVCIFSFYLYYVGLYISYHWSSSQQLVIHWIHNILFF